MVVRAKDTSANGVILVEDVVSDRRIPTSGWSVVNLTFTAERVETAITVSGSVKGQGDIHFFDFETRDRTAL